jgi:PAS domain S-box-containing protein
MARSWQSTDAGGYLVAVLATGAALLARIVSVALLGIHTPFFPFFLAVLAAAWYGGLKPGLLATALGTVLGVYLFAQPSHALWTGNPSSLLVSVLFVVIGVTASATCGALHAARRRTEDRQLRLEQAEQQIRAVLNHVIDGIVTLDEVGTVQSLNPAAEKMFGYAAAEVVGKNINMLMPPSYHAEHAKYLAECLQTGEAKSMGSGWEVVGHRKDGSTFPMDLAFGTFRLGERRYLTGIVRDVTELKKAERARIEANQRKDEFLATLAHELRNHLAPIRNAVEVLEHAEGKADLNAQARGIMERQLELMVLLIDDLLDVSRITSGKLHLRKERVELASVVHSAVEAARPSIQHQTHELTVTLPPQPVYLDADPTRLAQVILNLLTNAAKYTEKGGHIWLTAERQDGEVVMSVRDTGIGIAQEHLPHLFRIFSQVSSALERSQGGLGIGLSLVRGLVELHGGSVEARSGGPGMGSEFLVRLPVAEAPEAGPAGPNGDSEQLRSYCKCRILVVDDNQDAADSTAMILGLLGHDTQTAHDGLEALQAAASYRPGVVLLDLGLPKMNGYEVARHIRAQSWGRNMALIALTSMGQEEDKRRSQEAGFDHHLTKPVAGNVLESVLALVVPGREI